MDPVVDRLESVMDSDPPYVALLNNLGGTTVLEMQVLAVELATSKIANRVEFIVGPASLMTSMEMRGFSISVLAATSDEVETLSLPTSLAAWPGMTEISPVTVFDLPTVCAQSVPCPAPIPPRGLCRPSVARSWSRRRKT